MDFKKKLKAFLTSILSFVMVFTAIPFTVHAEDIGGNTGISGSDIFNVEWRLMSDENGSPVLRMHLRSGDYEYLGRECRIESGPNAGKVHSQYASYASLSNGGSTLKGWLNELANNSNFSNIDFIRYSALDFDPPLSTGIDFNRESGCYAAWTDAIIGSEYKIEDASPGQVAVEIDLEFFQKPQGGFDVYCSYDDDGIDGNELYQSKRYSDTTWDNTENRFIGLPDPGENYHWELIWASFSDQNWFNYSEIGTPTAVAWTDPNNHIDIANNGMALGGSTGVSPCDEIRKKCADDGVVYRLGFCRRPTTPPKQGTWGIWLDENGDGHFDDKEKHMIDLDPDGEEKQLFQLIDNGEWELVSLYRDDTWGPYKKSPEYGNEQLAAVTLHGTKPIQPNETVDLMSHFRLSDTINKLLSESDQAFGGEFYLGFKRKAKGTWGIWLDENGDGRFNDKEYKELDQDPSEEKWLGFPAVGYGHEFIEDEWELTHIYTATSGRWDPFRESPIYGQDKTPAEKMDNNLDIELIHPKDILDGSPSGDTVGPTDEVRKFLQEYDGVTNTKFGGVIWFGFRRKVKVFKVTYDLNGGTGDSDTQSVKVDGKTLIVPLPYFSPPFQTRVWGETLPGSEGCQPLRQVRMGRSSGYRLLPHPGL